MGSPCGLSLLLLVVLPILAAALRPDFTFTPQGPVPKKCVFQVPNGAHITESPEGTLQYKDPDTHQMIRLGSCDLTPYFDPTLPPEYFGLPADYDGWLAFTSNMTKTTFDTFLGNFSVPDAPEHDPQVLYIFTGLQNVDWIPKIDPPPQVFDIIQPVLQYPGDDGNYWSVKSWYVTLDQGVVVSKELKVNIGTFVFGNMTRTGPQTWYIGSTNSANETVSISVTRNRLLNQPWAYNTLEGYGVMGCTYEPQNPTQFTALELTVDSKLVSPEWKSFQSPNPKCHETATINSPDSVTISFQ
jgi:hypothetical protein